MEYTIIKGNAWDLIENILTVIGGELTLEWEGGPPGSTSPA
jgi:hypothetical protein